MINELPVFERIHNLNVSYLLNVRSILLEDYALGCFRLGIDDILGQAILSVKQQQLLILSETSQLIFSPRFTAEEIKLLTQRSPDETLKSIHMSILLASKLYRGD